MEVITWKDQCIAEFSGKQNTWRDKANMICYIALRGEAPEWWLLGSREIKMHHGGFNPYTIRSQSIKKTYQSFSKKRELFMNMHVGIIIKK